MSVSYYLHENHLSSEPNEFRAFVQPSRTVDLEGVIDRMLETGSTVVKADIVSVLEVFNSTMQIMLSEGVNVNTPFANFRSSIKGSFNGANDSYDKTRHKIVPSVTAGKKLKDYYKQNVTATKIEVRINKPHLATYIDYASGESNKLITPGVFACIRGKYLKVEKEEKTQGVFYIDEEGLETRVEIIGENFSSKLSFMNPNSLKPGNYRLEVRTGNNVSGSLNKVLNVANT